MPALRELAGTRYGIGSLSVELYRDAVCPVCEKVFLTSQEWAYKERDGTKYCSYTCMRKVRFRQEEKRKRWFASEQRKAEKIEKVLGDGEEWESELDEQEGNMLEYDIDKRWRGNPTVYERIQECRMKIALFKDKIENSRDKKQRKNAFNGLHRWEDNLREAYNIKLLRENRQEGERA